MEEMLCPECMGVLETSDGRTARCTIDGRDYEILFSRRPPPARASHGASPQAGVAASPLEPPRPIAARCPSCGREFQVSPKHAGKTVRCKACQTPFEIPEAQAPPAAKTVPAGTCVQHTGVPAEFACRNCGALICGTCAFPQADGAQLCPDCATGKRPAKAVSAGVVGPPRALIGVTCINHPDVQAMRRCKNCRAAICETCTFTFPGRLYVCPNCATSQEEFTPKRRRYLIGSFVCAAIATVGYVFLFGGVPLGLVTTVEGAQILGTVALFWILGSSITGVALASAARAPGRPRPVSLWLALIWNTLLLVGLLLLWIVTAALQ